MGADLNITRNGVAIPLFNRRMVTHIVSATQSWALNADDIVTISVESTLPLTFEIGDELTVFGRDYTLNRLPKITKGGAFDFKYDLEFEGIQYDLLRVMYDVNIDTTSNELQDIQGESLTGNLRRFMTVLIANMNRVFPNKWILGDCPETVSDKTLTFGDSDNCLAVLQDLCSEDNFNVEFEIAKQSGNYIINLKSQVGQTLPYIFRYGRGKGLYALNRQNVSNANIVTRLKVFGSTENITSKYRADRLCLPGKTKGQSYIESDVAIAKYGIFEGRKDFDIKPSYPGVVTSITDNVLEFVDVNFPFDLNEKEDDGVTTKYLINGLAAKIHFNTGNLAGYEFEIHSYDHASHKFTLVKQTDERGYSFPSETSPAFQIQSGAEYKILDVAYPAEITDEAEEKLLQEAETYYAQNSQPKVQYGLTVTKLWLQSVLSGQAGIVNVFAPGDYVQIEDEDIAVNKAIRIKSFTRNILDPYDYTLTISDTTASSTISNRILSELIDIDKIININNLKDPARARANWRSSREVLDMIFDTDGHLYTDKIAPGAIDTLMLSVGAKSQQFGLVGTRFEPNAGGNVNALSWSGGVLTHYTIDDSGVVNWNLANGSATGLNPNLPYYIYARCSRAYNNYTGGGTIIISTQQIKFDAENNCYNFLIGILNSVDTELSVRTISLTYGFSTINGRFIKTGRIESSGGANSYFDLDDGSMNLGDKLIFNKDGDGRMLLKGTFVQSQSGDTFPAGCFRGEYVPGSTYYQGDCVTYTADGATSTYMCIDECTNIVPTNVRYWSIYASQGANGKDGIDGQDGKDGIDGISPNAAFKATAFLRCNPEPLTPTGGSYSSPVPTSFDWSDGIPSGSETLWVSTRIFSSDGKYPQESSWSTPKALTNTASMEIQYSAVENSPGDPTRQPQNWSATADEDTIWMAVRTCENGSWSAWQISKIKGESGADGTSVHILGEFVDVVDNISDATSVISRGEIYLVKANEDDGDSPCWVVKKTNKLLAGQGYQTIISQATDGDGYVKTSNGHLFIASTSSEQWLDAGQIKGDDGNPGANGLNAYVHIKFANSLTEGDWTENDGEKPGAYIGIYTDNKVNDELTWSLYSWTRWQGQDGYGYEYIYQRTATAAAPSTPDDSAQQSDDYVPTGWTDDPTGVDASHPYEWVCYRKKTDGIWGQFIGSAADSTKAALWAKYGKDGADGADGVDGADGTPGDFTEFRFAVNGSPTEPPSLVRYSRTPSGWSLTKPEMSTAQYMWMIFTNIAGANNTLLQIWSKPIRVTGEKGADGVNGIDGISYSHTVEYYQWGLSGTTVPTGDWTQDKIPTKPNSQYKYLWNFERVYNSNDDYTDTAAHVVGSDGKEISSFDEFYMAHNSGTTAPILNPSLWQTTIPPLTEEYPYLWNLEVVHYTDGTFDNKVHLIAQRGNDGADGADGIDGESPVMVFRGAYSPYKTYYGNANRLDCVQYNGVYYIARIDAPTNSFFDKIPTNTAYWNEFGASFESVATELLLAENANIANLMFRNQRLESTASSNGVPNFFLDGLKNIASFASGNVVFDKQAAKIGWIRIIGQDLVGYDSDNVERLRFTPNLLPDVSSFGTQMASITNSGSSDGADIEIDGSSYLASKSVSQMTDRESGVYQDNGQFSCWVDLLIPSPATKLMLSDMQYHCTGQTILGDIITPTCSVLVNVTNNGTSIGTVDLSSANPQITIPNAGTARLQFIVSCNYNEDWNGTAYIDFQGFPISVNANYTVIAKDGIMSIFNGNYMRMHSSEGFVVKIGNTHFKIASTGVAKSSDGTNWSYL